MFIKMLITLCAVFVITMFTLIALTAYQLESPKHLKISLVALAAVTIFECIHIYNIWSI